MVSSHLRSSFIFCWWWYFCHLTLAQAEGSASACTVQKTLWAGRLESLAWPTTTRRNPVKQERRLQTVLTIPPGGSTEKPGDDEDGSNGKWALSLKKVSVAVAAFALQQTLTRIVGSGKVSDPPSVAQDKQLLILPENTEATAVSEEDTLTSSKGATSEEDTLTSSEGATSEEDTLTSSEGATMSQHVFNMVKGIVGVGVLSIPSGIAAFGNARSAAIPAIAIVALIGLLSAIGFSWTGEVCDTLVQDRNCEITAPTYRQAWSYSISEKSSWIPAISTTSMTFAACLCFSMVLADSLTDLVKPMVASAGRTSVLWSVTGIVLLPLCWMKDLKSLAPFSLLGVLGMAYTGLAMAGRFFHGSYELGSPLLQKIPSTMRPSFGKEGWAAVFKPGSITLVSMLSTAYMCHYNAPKFYNELKDNTMPRFNAAVAAGFGISILMTAFIACIGFLTFGGNSNGFILNNYAPNDLVMSLSRVAVAVSLTFSYPLCFQGLRDGVLDVIQIAPQDRSMLHLNAATVALLLALTFLATLLKDVSAVLALAGATLGNLLCYIFPAIMHGRVNPGARVPAILLGSTGVILGIIGVKLALQPM